jgi:hypothetical protein
LAGTGRITSSSIQAEISAGRYGMFGLAVQQEWEWLSTVLRQSLDVPA